MVAGSGNCLAAKGSAMDLEGTGPVGCCFSFPSSVFIMCSSLSCLSLGMGGCAILLASLRIPVLSWPE